MNQSDVYSEVQRVMRAEAQAVAALADTIKQEQVDAVVDALISCRGRVVVAGCGTSGVAGRKIVHMLNCIERAAHFMIPSDAIHGALGALRPDDVLILLSKGGSTAEITPLVPACKQKGAKLIAVTENPDSVIGKAADVLLEIRVEKEPDPFNMLATSSILATIAAFDAICIAMLQCMGYTKEQFAVIHPSGAVGERLLGKA